MKFWINFFKDKRYPLRFKFANLIMKDELRNCLTFDILFNAKEISGSIDPEKLMS